MNNSRKGGYFGHCSLYIGPLSEGDTVLSQYPRAATTTDHTPFFLWALPAHRKHSEFSHTLVATSGGSCGRAGAVVWVRGARGEEVARVLTRLAGTGIMTRGVYTQSRQAAPS